MITFTDIKKSFGDKVVLDGVSHKMETGKTNLIIGTSGSGKTVLQKCLVGLMEPNSGTISYDGVSFTDMTQEDRKLLRQQIGMLFQGSALFDSMTVEQNIKFPLDMFTKDTNATKLKRVNEVLDREYNITTIINTHDMNSVMEIGDNILFMVQGKKEWTGSSKDIIFSDNKILNEFIFASEFLQDAKQMRMMELKGEKIG